MKNKHSKENVVKIGGNSVPKTSGRGRQIDFKPISKGKMSPTGRSPVNAVESARSRKLPTHSEYNQSQ